MKVCSKFETRCGKRWELQLKKEDDFLVFYSSKDERGYDDDIDRDKV